MITRKTPENKTFIRPSRCIQCNEVRKKWLVARDITN